MPQPNLSRRAFLRHAAQVAAGTLIAGCAAVDFAVVPMAASPVSASALPRGHGQEPVPPVEGGVIAPSLPTPDDASLDFKIGQMLLLGFHGTTAADDSVIMRSVRDFNLGGVVLFRHNVKTPEQLSALNGSLQTASREAHGAPLFVAVDQEGGRTSRLDERFGLADDPAARDFGQADDLSRTYEHARTTATALQNFGFNLNLAPVVDLDVNTSSPAIGAHGRSFSPDPEVVVRHASAFIQAHHEHNLLCSLKHFPGHGSAAKDSHLGFVDVSDTWSDIELAPYKRLIDSGLADMIMSAHVFNSALDPYLPATLSHNVLTNILRAQLGHWRLIITDDMQMGAIRNQYSYDEAVRLTILAGADVIAISNHNHRDQGIAAYTVGLIKSLVEAGQIAESRIHESYLRVHQAKQRLVA